MTKKQINGKEGRPSKYKEVITKTILELIPFWVIKGLTEKDIAEKLGINLDTLKEWKKDITKAEFSTALNESRGTADCMVEGTLFKKALAGDTTAMIFWLKNRRRNDWRDKQDIEHSGSVKTGIDFSKMSKEEADTIISILKKNENQD